MKLRGDGDRYRLFLNFTQEAALIETVMIGPVESLRSPHAGILEEIKNMDPGNPGSNFFYFLNGAWKTFSKQVPKVSK